MNKNYDRAHIVLSTVGIGCIDQLCTGYLDRKSTRLNSSHQIISYAVFCLKKKNNKYQIFLNQFLPQRQPPSLSSLLPPPPTSTLFPYTTLFRSYLTGHNL